MAIGKCNCGAVEFEINPCPRDIYICHCSICRRKSGANGAAVVVFPNDAFRWVKGERYVAHWIKPDADWQSWFCKICGSPLPGKNDENTMFAPVGLLDNEPDAPRKVAHHIWVDSKADWDEIGDDGKQHNFAFSE